MNISVWQCVCQNPWHDGFFSGYNGFPTNKTDRYNITKIM